MYAKNQHNSLIFLVQKQLQTTKQVENFLHFRGKYHNEIGTLHDLSFLICFDSNDRCLVMNVWFSHKFRPEFRKDYRYEKT